MPGVPQVSRGSRPGIPYLGSTLKVHSSHHRVGDAFYPPHEPKLLRRYYGAGDLHFITGSCYGRQPVLHTAQRRDPFLTVLEQVRKRYRFVVMGYVVMPEHFHLLISEPRKGDPSTVMQALKLGFARRLLAAIARAQVSKTARPGAPRVGGSTSSHVWQARFYDFNVWTERKRIEKLRYIHRNPVVRGLVMAPDQWRWSSFRAYAYGELGPVRVNDWQILEMKMTGHALSGSAVLS